MDTYKVWLVAKGYTQKKNIDYFDIVLKERQSVLIFYSHVKYIYNSTRYNLGKLITMHKAKHE